MVFSILCNFWQAASRLFLQHEGKNDADSHEYFLLKEERFQKIMILVKQSHSVCFYIVSFLLAISTYLHPARYLINITIITKEPKNKKQ